MERWQKCIIVEDNPSKRVALQTALKGRVGEVTWFDDLYWEGDVVKVANFIVSNENGLAILDKGIVLSSSLKEALERARVERGGGREAKVILTSGEGVVTAEMVEAMRWLGAVGYVDGLDLGVFGIALMKGLGVFEALGRVDGLKKDVFLKYNRERRFP